MPEKDFGSALYSGAASLGKVTVITSLFNFIYS